jgi:pimeloyl-ACP methyl ester carboxylesterase
MKKSILVMCLLTVAGGAAGGTAACSSTGDANANGPDAGSGIFPELACTDTIDSVYADPGDVRAQPKGAILKCAFDKDISAQELYDALTKNNNGSDPNYAGRMFTSGAHVYRVLYRTERGDPNNSPGYSSALLLLPDTPRAAQLPVVVASHGSRGQNGACAPSKATPQGAYVQADFRLLVYPLVGLGYPVIAPDLAGYANYGGTGNPPSAYASVQDVGKSTLDGARALANLIPNAVNGKVALVGHSQGGHTTLSALYLASTYGAGLDIAAVATYAPLWWTQRSWGLVFLDPTSYSFQNSAGGKVSILYHYTHGELLDGPGHGLDLINPSKQTAVTTFVNDDCWAKDYPVLEDAGASANDIFLSSYADSISTAALSDNCGKDATCQTWLDRMTSDWPHLTGAATQVPMLALYAQQDNTITPDLMACVYRRLTEDQMNYQTCYVTDPKAMGHAGSLAAKGDYVADWIAQQTLGAPAPNETCWPLATNDAGTPQIPGPDGGAVACNGLLPDK